MNLCGEELHTKPSRKSQLIRNLDDAVREVHEHLSCFRHLRQAEDLKNNASTKLIFSLDDIFTYLLYSPHNGYWPVFQSLLPISTLTFINKLTFTTNFFGKGRAWLLLSLNEGLLETYLSCLESQPSLLSKHYQPESILRDSHSFKVLLGLVSSLAHVHFNYLIDVEHFNMSMTESSLKRFSLDHEDIVLTCSEKPQMKKKNAPITWQPRISTRLLQQPNPSKNPIMSDGALLRRRSLFPTGAARKVIQKRFSFHPSIQSRHHQSQWTLVDDDSEVGHRGNGGGGGKPHRCSHLRRYVSDMFINETADLSYKLFIERGAPEGQEDPDDLGVASEHPLTSSKCSGQGVSPQWKQTLLDSAKKKWSSSFNNINLPLPTVIKSIHCADAAGDIQIVRKTPPPDEDVGALEIAITLGLDVNDPYKVAHCYQGFYAGRPNRSVVLFGQKAIYVATRAPNLSLVWSSQWADISHVSVKWNYSTLSLSSGEAALELDFGDPHALRMCAGWLDMALRRVGKGNCIVAMETPFQCRSFWHPWMQQHTTDIGADMEYIGLVYFEESLTANCRESDPADASCWKAGDLMYRWSNSSTWRAGYFVIKSGMLHQFHNTSDRSAAFRTLLNEQECRGYGRNFHSSRPHIIEIHFCRRPSLLLAAASETEAADWLTAVAQSELAGQEALPTRTAAQHPPSACGVIVTDKNIILFQSDRLLASAPLHTVALIMTSPQDYFCIIEFDCREALEGAGDWIFYFQSSESYQDFLQAARRPRQSLAEDTCSKLRKINLSLKQSNC